MIKKKISLEILVPFTKQIATAIKSGVPLTRSLLMLLPKDEKKHVHKNKQQLMVKELFKHIYVGKTFSHALSICPFALPQSYIAMVKSGEISGDLGGALERIAGLLENELLLVRKIKAALTYPALMLLVSIAIVFGIVKWVFPTLLGVLKGIGGNLPLITKIVILLVSGLESPYVIGLAIVILVPGSLYFKKFIQREKTREQIDRVILNLPVLGAIALKIATTRFCKTLASLYKSGVPLMECLSVSREVAGNRVIAREIERIQEAVTNGDKISTAMYEGGIFPSPVVHMMGVAESTGEVSDLLGHIADYYDAEVETTLESLSALLEPLIIIFLGFIMGAFILAIFLPLYELIGKLGG